MKLEVIKQQKNEFLFRLLDTDGEPLLISDSYRLQDTLMSDLEILRTIITRPGSIEKKKTGDDYYYFTIADLTGRIICHSTLFYNENLRDKWLNDIQKIGPELMSLTG
jgi:hypothetical protein